MSENGSSVIMDKKTKENDLNENDEKYDDLLAIQVSAFFLLKNLIDNDNYKVDIKNNVNNKQSKQKKINEITKPDDMTKKTIKFEITTKDDSKFEINFRKKNSKNYDNTITLTFGEAGENHTGMQLIGKKRNSGDGFSFEKLENLNNELKKENKNSELIQFPLDEEEKDYNGETAGILIIRNYLKDTHLYEILNNNIEWDNEFIDNKKIFKKEQYL